MTDPAQTLWLQTLLALAVLGAALVLHLKWHPLRECFSDAWDMLQSFGWLVPMIAAMYLMPGAADPWAVPQTGALRDTMTAWRGMLKMLPGSAQDMARLTHGFFPPWPSALSVPVLLTLLAWRVRRFPYRYDSRRKRPEVLWMLGIVTVFAWTWLGLELLGSRGLMPEWLETLRLMLRWLAEAWMMAAAGVFLIRLVTGWDEPTEPSDEKDLWLALEKTLAHWRGILLLAAVNLLWLLAWRSTVVTGNKVVAWMMVEASLVFAALPLVVARFRAPWAVLAEVLARVFAKTVLPMLGLAVTATAILMLVHFAMHSLFLLVPETPVWTGLLRILIALVLATVRSWLFLALVLTLLRHGLKAASSQKAENGCVPHD